MDYKYIVKNIVSIIVLIIASLLIKNYILYVVFIFIHEVSHCITGLLLGYKYRRFYILPFGLYVYFEDEFIKPLDDIKISMSGPLINFVFFVFFYILSKRGLNGCELLKNINLVLGIFNLIPAGFLDGGRILRVIISYNISFYYAYKIINLNGLLLGCIIVVVSLFRDLDIENLFFIFLGVMVIIKSIWNKGQILIKTISDVLYKQRMFNSIKFLKVEYRVFSNEITLVDIIKLFCFNKYYMVLNAFQGKPDFTISEMDIIKYYLRYGNISLGRCMSYLNTQEE
ncbi:site-2 protease family protein [Fonticella tunisiensis]|uniref:Stage IV sporulation protein FB n=1 Tax=Fonticella tunisiensis TaxID=1096341 RepID=A0A4R7KR45_9CLOT|nr:site-2 protease family protein [Fonticella tunisiensis]TDT61206.1 stage IV sporulation protein FB [Fonticella tunisiensis]